MPNMATCPHRLCVLLTENFVGTFVALRHFCQKPAEAVIVIRPLFIQLLDRMPHLVKVLSQLGDLLALVEKACKAHKVAFSRVRSCAGHGSWPLLLPAPPCLPTRRF